MEELHGILLGLKAFSGSGHQLLQSVVRELNNFVEILALSSIYKVQGKITSSHGIHDVRSIESFSALSVVLKGASRFDPLFLLKRFAEIEFQLRSEVLHRSVSVNLLAYEGRTILTPQLTLPHPHLHSQLDQLVPAAEVWSDFLHPVLNKSLISMAQANSHEKWGEFYAQGKTLLDF